MISILLNLLKFKCSGHVLWSSFWSILKNVPCTLEENVHYVVGWKLLWRLLDLVGS